REMLMKLTTLDLHPSQFAPGAVTGSLFGRATATLHCREDTSGFVLFVRRSFADYLWCALAEAGREFGLVEQVPKGGETMRV
ncbi:MAG: sarcosine oxidase subunit gamma family protein, partial [Pseudomonadota bacterium]